MRRRQLAIVAALLVGGLVVLALGVRVTHGDRVLPGVRVAGVGLGGLSEDDARRRLSSLASELSSGAVVLRAGDRRVTIAPAQAGYSVDVAQTVSRALDSGRGGPLGGMWSTVAGLFTARDVPLAETIDRARLERTVGSAAGRFGGSSFAGELAIEPGTLAVSIRPPRPGREVDRRELAAQLSEALMRRRRAVIAVPLRDVPAATRADVEAVGRAAREYLREPLRLTGAGDPLEVSPADVATVLALESQQGGRSVRLGAGDRRLAALVDQLAAKLDRPARDARIDAPARVVTFAAKGPAAWRPRAADVAVTTPARAGRTIRRPELAAAIEAAIRAGRHSVEVPTQRIEPTVSADAARRMRFLIGTFTTYYVPGQPRVTNIALIARAVDGTLVAPGARFSLNAVAGERTSAKGYVEAPFIADGKIEPSIGGGVSQFSTTLYNAAYFAGLQLDAHRPHSFFIDRYPAGREATLNFPDIDLTWTNDTDAPVLIRASTDGNSVAVSLYGDTGGRRVEAQHGRRTPLEERDFQVVVTRVVRHADGRTVRQPYTTRYDEPPPPDE